ncbi:YbaK/EbsC family protein [Sansalvadorimonas sp. 2012CJ34-2]|uniref:YbaK/EbsC family protein n=1 Tax=Parendozoicomonas callyspongiae TaxID=2942213 RepID=A0ABT0PK15_9GAMM|nr:YbaK/EbsC family protein [Sansalvadorimonas sp. 2012CJ34-2]MCL6271611.1 YbaK/EbsC family protein [Sansalvadorimonas sp. 2012CJ34-2]
MTISRHLKNFLSTHDAEYDVVAHPYTERALDTAHSACIPTKTMAKAVVLKDEGGLVMAVMPANNKLMLKQLNQSMDRHLKLVQEQTLKELFPDCQAGSIPAIGEPWGMMTACDDSLNDVTDIYFEGGNHRELIHMHRDQYQQLMTSQLHLHLSCIPDEQELYKGGVE